MASMGGFGSRIKEAFKDLVELAQIWGMFLITFMIMLVVVGVVAGVVTSGTITGVPKNVTRAINYTVNQIYTYAITFLGAFSLATGLVALAIILILFRDFFQTKVAGRSRRSSGVRQQYY